MFEHNKIIFVEKKSGKGERYYLNNRYNVGLKYILLYYPDCKAAERVISLK